MPWGVCAVAGRDQPFPQPQVRVALRSRRSHWQGPHLVRLLDKNGESHLKNAGEHPGIANLTGVVEPETLIVNLIDAMCYISETVAIAEWSTYYQPPSSESPCTSASQLPRFFCCSAGSCRGTRKIYFRWPCVVELFLNQRSISSGTMSKTLNPSSLAYLRAWWISKQKVC